jgi:hypothetical protein
MGSNYYLYGVLEAPEQVCLATLGLERQAVTAIPFREIAVMASPWQPEVVPATPENCLAHERVLAEVIKTKGILPFEFGTLAPDLAAVDSLLRRNYSQFKRTLGKLCGAIEINVTASWHDLKAICEEVLKAHPTIAGYKREIMSRPYDQTYQDRLRIGQIVADALEAKKHSEGERLYNDLRKKASGACQVCMGKPSGDGVIFTGAFLVKRGAFPDFERNLLELGSRHGSRVDFRYTDALPPYHFVDLKIVV